MAYHDNEPFRFSPTDVARVREVFLQSGYNLKGVQEALGLENLFALGSQDIEMLVRRTCEPTQLNTLIHWFMLGLPVEAQRAKASVAPMQLAEWVEGGLLDFDGTVATAGVAITPYQNLLFAYDLPPRADRQPLNNYVMGVGTSSMTLANITIRSPRQATLDLGAGCGIQALVAASHSQRVVAADRNVRAVEFTRFNAALNGMQHIDCRAGDLFHPVRGEQFDLVVSNPPFVISPEAKFIYRDSGMHGDQICQRIVEEVPPYLAEGGYCQLLCNWAHFQGQDWRDRLAGWFEKTGCDAWVLCSETHDAETYATTWIKHTEGKHTQQFAERFREWMNYYHRQNIDAMSAGVITLRKASGRKNWFHAEEAPEQMLGPCGSDVLRGFALWDFLEVLPKEESLLDIRLRVSPDLRLQQQCRPGERGWLPVEEQLYLTRGLAYRGSVDRPVADLVGRCDGSKRLGELIAELAANYEIAIDALAPACLRVVRKLIERGFLWPADWGDNIPA